jgi:hypothetical protein
LASSTLSSQTWDLISTIEVKYVSVAHPRAYGQVKHANGLILDGLKKILYDENKKKGASGFMSSL